MSTAEDLLRDKWLGMAHTSRIGRNLKAVERVCTLSHINIKARDRTQEIDCVIPGLIFVVNSGTMPRGIIEFPLPVEPPGSTAHVIDIVTDYIQKIRKFNK
jgi:hypothetical protein